MAVQIFKINSLKKELIWKPEDRHRQPKTNPPPPVPLQPVHSHQLNNLHRLRLKIHFSRELLTLQLMTIPNVVQWQGGALTLEVETMSEMKLMAGITIGKLEC